ncbi:MAG: hypothetical protein NTW68_05120 [candidate division NC10 bacterium]|nr:hypothetical protein [candidate division NC10 bacterium]
MNVTGATIVRQVAPDRLEIKEGGGCLALFGVPFLAAGIFVTLIGVRIVPLANARDIPAWGWPLIVLMGLAFMAVGGALVFGRRWIIVDAGRGTVSKHWGLLVPMRGETLSLAGYDAVVVRLQSGDSDSVDRYPVLLRATGGGADLPLQSTTQYGESREGAAAIAKLLRLPLVDAATTHESVLAADRADAPFPEQPPGADLRGDAPRPLRMKCQVRESSRTVEIILPGPGFQWRKLVGPAISVGVLSYLAPELLRFFRQTHTPEAVQTAILGFTVFFFVVIPLVGIFNAARLASRGRTLVTASPEGIVIEERGAWRARSTRLPAVEILGLDYGTAEDAFASAQRGAEQRVLARRGVAPRWLAVMRRFVASKGITVKSRKGLFTFGAGLPDDEVRYLHALIVRALGDPDGRRW